MVTFSFRFEEVELCLTTSIAFLNIAADISFLKCLISTDARANYDFAMASLKNMLAQLRVCLERLSRKITGTELQLYAILSDESEGKLEPQGEAMKCMGESKPNIHDTLLYLKITLCWHLANLPSKQLNELGTLQTTLDFMLAFSRARTEADIGRVLQEAHYVENISFLPVKQLARVAIWRECVDEAFLRSARQEAALRYLFQ